MSRLEELIQEYCPDGINYVMVKDVVDSFIGLATSVTKYKRETGVQLLHNSDIRENKIVVKKVEFIDPIFAEKNSSKIMKMNDVITVHTGDVGTSAVITEEFNGAIGFTTITSRIKNTEMLDPYYLAYCYNSNNFKKQIEKVSISDRNNLNQKEFENLEVPLPALPVQREIVRILDSFTMYSAELAAELAARKEQYEYYSKMLLSFNDETQVMDLNEIAEIYDSLHQTPKYVTDGFPMIRVQDVTSGVIDVTKALLVSEEDFEKFTAKYKPQAMDIVVSRVGSFGRFGIVPYSDCCIGQNVAIIHPLIDPKYLYYFINSQQVKNWIVDHAKGAGHKAFSLADIRKIPIRVPPISTQKKIVQQLACFDNLVSDYFKGLPAEIEARQKQYEYYRDKLLSFKRLNVS